MPIKFFNTLTWKKEAFKPIHKNQVLMYNCGPTTYAPPHIGNMRSFIMADLIRRYLEFRGFKVKQVMNLTDIDDKTIRDSGKEGVSLKEFTERYIRIFFDYLDMLKIKRATIYPKATENVNEMIEMVRELVKKGYAYENSGSVYFSIKKFKDYGKLSHLDMKRIKIGARIAADEYTKDNPRDFALMKRSTTEELKRGIFYETEWGKVRPGWHIECSVMILKYLGETVDIHTGGVDLIFPHHENEIAQSEAYLGKKHVNYWIHNEHLLLNGEKMSKSMGNVITLEEAVKKFSPEVVRYMFVSVHRRQKLNYTDGFAENAKKNYERLKESLNHLNFTLDSAEMKKSKQDAVLLKKLTKIKKQFVEAMDDDLNTPLALTVFHQLSKEINKYLKKGKNRDVLKKALKLFEEFSEVLGLQFKKEEMLPKEVEDLIKLRGEARKRNDFEAADRIRRQIREMGYIIEDTEKGTRWKKVK
jgi:cysteinyl-tRNA synthetase